MKAARKKLRRQQARKPRKPKKPGKKRPRLNWVPVLPWLKTEKAEPFPEPGPDVEVFPERVVRKGDPKYFDLTMPPLRFRRRPKTQVKARS